MPEELRRLQLTRLGGDRLVVAADATQRRRKVCPQNASFCFDSANLRGLALTRGVHKIIQDYYRSPLITNNRLPY